MEATGGDRPGAPDPEQRERLIDAFTKVAAERGYLATAIEDVEVAADLGQGSFKAHFSDERQCLLAAYDNFFDRLIGEINAAMDLDAPWPTQVQAGVEAALGFMIESAAVARLFIVEAFSAGPPAIERYIAAVDRIVDLLRIGRERTATTAGLPALTESVLVAGGISLITAALLAEDDAGLAELEPRLVEVLLLPYVGATESPKLAS